MYAIIRSGGKQAKVREGDVIDVERLRADGDVTFTPLLLVDDKGKVTKGSDLKGARVTARVVGAAKGDKIDIFKYKAKTGYRNRGGHRQRYTTIEVLKIEGPKKPPGKAPADDEADAASEKAPPTEVAAKKAPAKTTADTPAKKPAAAKKAPAKTTAEAPAKKPAAKKPADEAPTEGKEG